jgi:Fe-Mn family superoxide dismutase
MKNKNSNRREFLKKIALGGVGVTLLHNSLAANESTGFPVEDIFTLPALPYAYDALEPFIDKQTMEIHHSKHHQAYVNNLNKAWAETGNRELSLEEICKNVSAYSLTIRNNAGGHYNHSIFWKWLKPNKGSIMSPSSPNEPMGKLGDAIKSAFDSFENLKTKFSETAMKVFGSGWAWLVVTKGGKMEIGSTPNQDNPLMDISPFQGTPILGLDVWEHAYYLKYQNKRADYIANWWNVVNWDEVAKRFYAK